MQCAVLHANARAAPPPPRPAPIEGAGEMCNAHAIDRLSPCAQSLDSTLAARAIEAGAPRLHDALDAAGRLDLAGAARAGMAFMLIDLPAMLEIAELAIRLDIVAQRRAAGRDRLLEHRLHGPGEALGPLALHGLRQPPRREAGAEQRLRGIDVADPGDDPLVEQGGLDGRALASECGGEDRPIEFGAQRLRPQALQQLVLRELRRLGQIHETEAPGIVEAERDITLGEE